MACKTMLSNLISGVLEGNKSKKGQTKDHTLVITFPKCRQIALTDPSGK